MSNDKPSSGTSDKIKGKTNEVVGHLRGDKSQELKGKAQKVMGDAKHAVRDVADKLQGK
ncbi:MAG: CsbD family protein [Candidatus Thermoplasmatota archaeon]